MSYIYLNNTNQTRIITLVSENRSSASHITIAAGSKIELSYPGLDAYVPHMLLRINELGQNISYLVKPVITEKTRLKLAAEAEAKKEVKEEVKEVLVPAIEVAVVEEPEEVAVEEAVEEPVDVAVDEIAPVAKKSAKSKATIKTKKA